MANADRIQFDAGMLGLLVCPACCGELRLDKERLECAVCGRAYPIVDGIPVLIAEGTETAASDNAIR